MEDGYDAPHLDDADGTPLDEMMCEYVDGTMDPVVRRAFEDLLRANPEMAAEAHCLCHLRLALQSYGRCKHAPAQFQQRLRQRLSTEARHPSAAWTNTAARLNAFALIASTAGLLCLLAVITLDARMLDTAATAQQPLPLQAQALFHDAPQVSLTMLPTAPLSPLRTLTPIPTDAFTPLAFSAAQPMRLELQRTHAAP